MEQQVYRLKKAAYHNSANCNFVSFDFTKDIHIAGRNNLGKTAKLNGLQIGYLPHTTFKGASKKFNFDEGYAEETSYDFYFPETNSFIIFEFENPHGTFCQIVYKGAGELAIERAFVSLPYDEILDWFWSFEAGDQIGLPTRITRKELVDTIKAVPGHKIVKTARDAKGIMYNGSLTDFSQGKFSIASVNEKRIENIQDILKLSSNASAIDSAMLKKVVVSLLHTNYQDNKRDVVKYDPVTLMEQFEKIKNDKETLTKKKNFIGSYNLIKIAFSTMYQEVSDQIYACNFRTQLIDALIEKTSKEVSENDKLQYKQHEIVEKTKTTGIGFKNEMVGAEKESDAFKKTLSKYINKKDNYNKIMYGEDSGYGVYNGDFNRVLEEIDITINLNTESTKGLDNIIEEARLQQADRLDLKELELSKENEEKRLKSYENSFVRNPKVNFIANKLVAINPAFASIQDCLTSENAETIIKFVSIFESKGNELVIGDVVFGKLRSSLKSIMEVERELDNLNSKIHRLKADINKRAKFLESNDPNQKETLRKELECVKREKAIINGYIGIKDFVDETEKDIIESDEKLKAAKDKHIICTAQYKSEKSELSNIKISGRVMKEKNNHYIAIGKSFKELTEKLGFTYEYMNAELPNDISDSDLSDESTVKIKLEGIKKYKQEIQKKLKEMVNNEIIEDDNSLLVKESFNYKELENDLVSKLDYVFQSIDTDEDELNKSFSRQAQLILDLSGDLGHYIGRYKSYVKKLNNELSNISLSSIDSIEIDVSYHPRVERFIQTIDSFGLSSDDAISSLDMGLEEQIRSFIFDMGLDKDRTMRIDINTLINTVSLKYTNENNFSTSKGSNGTSIITSVILISMFTREICGEDIAIIMPINVDEIGSVDWHNTMTVYNFIKSKGFCLFSASPTPPCSSVDLFDCIIPLEDFEFIDNPNVFLSKAKMTYHYTIGGTLNLKDDDIVDCLDLIDVSKVDNEVEKDELNVN